MLLENIQAALHLAWDAELWSVVALSLFVSGMATLVAFVASAPLAFLLGARAFRGEELIARVAYGLTSLPSVFVGLMVALALSRRGPLGAWELLYTPTGMILAQAILVFPLMFALLFAMVRGQGRDVVRTAETLGATPPQRAWLVLEELAPFVTGNVALCFSRAISEVGAVLIVGGNIRGETRVMTTSIAMYQSMGDYPRALALGGTLLLVAFASQCFMYRTRQRV